MRVQLLYYRFGGDEWRLLCVCKDYAAATKEKAHYIAERSYAVGTWVVTYDKDRFDIREEVVRGT